MSEPVEEIGRDEPCYPRALRTTPGAPRVLHVAGGRERLRALLAEPAVAIIGTRAASDYGTEVAYGLARGLAAAKVCVLGGLAEGIAAAAHEGALARDGPTLTVMPGGLDACTPASRAALYARIRGAGCAVSAQPCGTPARPWCYAVRSRIVVALAALVVVVEAEEPSATLTAARHAQLLGRSVAAVPGRVSSRAARGPHALLREGATLIRDAQDALDALYGIGGAHDADARAAAVGGTGAAGASSTTGIVGAEQTPGTSPAGTLTRGRKPCGPRPPALRPQLRALLEHVAGGRDTLAKLTAAGAPARETIVELTELELLGALARGAGGRYVATHAACPRAEPERGDRGTR